MWDVDACRLYELFAAARSGGHWHAGSGAIWDLRSNALRPDGWTSADAAGLPILPGPRALRGGRGRRDPSRHPLHRAGDARRAPLPGATPRGLGQRTSPAADGSARAAQGRLQHRRLRTAGPGDPRRDEALRDDPGRQRLAVVLQRRLGHPLGRRSAQRAEVAPGLGLRGRQHERLRQRPLTTLRGLADSFGGVRPRSRRSRRR